MSQCGQPGGSLKWGGNWGVSPSLRKTPCQILIAVSKDNVSMIALEIVLDINTTSLHALLYSILNFFALIALHVRFEAQYLSKAHLDFKQKLLEAPNHTPSSTKPHAHHLNIRTFTTCLLHPTPRRAQRLASFQECLATDANPAAVIPHPAPSVALEVFPLLWNSITSPNTWS